MAKVNKIDPDLQKKANEIMGKKNKKRKQVKATKDFIISRSKRTFPIPIEVDETEDEIEEVVFQARRLSPKERTDMAMLNIDTSNLAELSPDELEALEKQGYELLSKVIVEPDYSAEEWQEVDLALTQELINKVTILQYETNDAKAIESFRN